MKTTRNLWPYGIILAFALFAMGLTTVVVIAAAHPENLVSGGYYEQELRYQSQIDGAARAKKEGAKIQFDAAANRLVIVLPTGQAAQKPAGEVEFYRPSAPELDREFLLEPGVDGRQTLNVSQLAAGPWEIHVNWQAGGQGYYLEQRFAVAAK